MTKHDKRPPKAGPASLALDIARGRQLVNVTHPEVLRVLEQGLLHAMRNDAPHLMQIAEDSARAFPGYSDQAEPLPDGWAFFLGTAFDGLGRRAFLLRPVSMAGAEDRVAARRAAEAALMSEIREALAQPPSPSAPRHLTLGPRHPYMHLERMRRSP